MGAAKLLQEIGDGQLLIDLDTALERVLARIGEYKAGGEVTLKLFLAPATSTRDGEVRQLDVAWEVTAKEPKAPRLRSVMYVKDGELTRRDPRQPELPMTPKLAPAKAPNAEEVER